MDLTHVCFEGKPGFRRQALIEQLRPGAPRTRTGGSMPGGGFERTRVTGLPAFVLERAGVDPAAYRPAPLERRIGACLRALRLESESAAQRSLDAHPGLGPTALNALLIGVSTFFRDKPVFEALRAAVMPELGTRQGPLRVVSVGCSTGAELYSVAMLADEAGLLDRMTLLGVDCRTDAVLAARAGCFTTADVEGLCERRRARHFDRTATGWRVSARLRRATAWQVTDATRAIPAGPWDLALFRNVVIYLQPSAAQRILRNVCAELTPGGYLAVGKAERASGLQELTPAGPCLYRKHD